MKAKKQPASSKTSGLWLRNDLRLDDHPALLAAADGSEHLLPIFVFDPSKFRTATLGGALKSSARRARFLIESVKCMRQRLQTRGSGLAVFIGKPSEVLPRICSDCAEVCVTRGVCSEETSEEKDVESKIKPHQCGLKRVWGGMLYMPSDIGCRPDEVPLLFTKFKNTAESVGHIRNPIPAPQELPPLPALADPKLMGQLEEALTFLPSLEQLGYSADEADAALEDDPRGVMSFVGGETSAMRRIRKWMFDDDKLKEYFEIRNGMLGEAYSSKLSPWLALGCVSPRRIWKEAQKYEKQRIKNKSTYWLVFELIWRDFFFYMGLSQGNKIFLPGGVTGNRYGGSLDRGKAQALERWKAGKTGDALVDANMRELAATGFMSNRGRQNVASYLIFNLGVDWRLGAAHFEELLLDYDPCSNWGNWVAAAGLTGGRINRFNTRKQLNDYDPGRKYVNHWRDPGERPHDANDSGQQAREPAIKKKQAYSNRGGTFKLR
jgi:deoxyribodipyrimidine photo-lyase